MANLIPMAGLGMRFSEAGHRLPKALIPVSGMPMIVRAIRDMPKSDKWIFVVRKQHIDDFNIDRVIRSEVPGAAVIPVEETTEGQACTCMLAEGHLNPEEPLFIAACDSGFLYNEAEYAKLCNDPDVDCIVWTFTQRESLRTSPQSWGWCKLAGDKRTIREMSVKVPISDNPYDDHAVVANFYFRRAGDFIDAVNMMIREDYRINNEFYVDAVPLFLNRLGKRSVMFDVDHYLGWGRPEDLYEYQLMEYVCGNSSSEKPLGDEDRGLLPLWRRYFEKVKKERDK